MHASFFIMLFVYALRSFSDNKTGSGCAECYVDNESCAQVVYHIFAVFNYFTITNDVQRCTAYLNTMFHSEASKTSCSKTEEIIHCATGNSQNSDNDNKNSKLDQHDDCDQSPSENQYIGSPDLDAIQKLISTIDDQSIDQRIALETMAKLALDSAVNQTEKRYEYLLHRFGSLNKKHEYENYDELCDLGDKIMNGFGIMEDNQIYQIDLKSRVRLTTMVLGAQNEALTYYEKSLDEFGHRRDQQLAAEYETLTFWTQFLSKTYMEFHVTWLKCFIDQ